MKTVKTLFLKGESLYILDQSLLPSRMEYIECRSAEDVADCIARMRIRGAPAIGVAAAYGLALSIAGCQTEDLEELKRELEKAYRLLRGTRPTAYNLFWALDRVRNRILEACSVDEARRIALSEAIRMEEEDIEANRRIGFYGEKLIEDGDRILTHCNAGALATAGWGTALGVIRSAIAAGKSVKVYATETRPKLQGARLTAFELLSEGIPVTLITDGMVGFIMSRGYIDKVIVGADRIALNGDTANKIGTYTIAVLARRHNIPFYIAAPTSTIDPGIRSGDGIPIEYRSQDEVLEISGVRIAPDGVEALNPAFDITPGELITAIITEKGIVRPPYIENIPKILNP
ncbi:MAG: S-methyl-5-thioribose-1-phosphate isomerase [Candidatus Bathyarchaeia archaeon]